MVINTISVSVHFEGKVSSSIQLRSLSDLKTFVTVLKPGATLSIFIHDYTAYETCHLISWDESGFRSIGKGTPREHFYIKELNK